MNHRLQSNLLVRSLEDRTAPAVFTVMNLNDSGADSLRDCVAKANASPGADGIHFNAGLAGIITLTSGQLAVTGPTTIQGPGAALLVISGNNASRIFDISAAAGDTGITISGLTLRDAKIAGYGGAIFGDNQTLTLSGCVFNQNTTTSLGGGAVAMTAGGTMKATDCDFSDNIAFAAGGALNLFGSGTIVSLMRCTISGNKAANAGGLYVAGGFLLDSCTVSGNTATFRGGGLFVSNNNIETATVFTVRNSTISGNSADKGGGIALYSFAKVLTVQNTTVTANKATDSGGGIIRFGTGTIAIESSVVSGNSGGLLGMDILSGGTVTMKTSAVGSGTGFTQTDQGGNLPFQPHANLKLGPLADNGGPTKTHLPGAASPLIDAGSNPSALTTDQRGFGFPRVIGSMADIGAVEVVSLLVTTTADSGAGSLRQAIQHANFRSGTDTVTFDPTFFATAKTITLSTGEIAITEAVTVLGPAAKVTIDGNAAGRIFNIQSALTGAAIELSNLKLTNGRADGGGAIEVTTGTVVLRFCEITSCTSTSFGGAINIDGISSLSSLVIEDSTLSGNTATFDGGALFDISEGTVVVRRSTVSGNKAGSAGAIESEGSLIIEDSTLSGNTATETAFGGGAILCIGGASKLFISNSTLSGNKAPLATGGAVGILSFEQTASFQNCTITDNSAKVSGGGISFASGQGFVIIDSTIVAGNVSADAPDLSFNLAAKVRGNNNLIGVADAGNFALMGTGNLTGTKSIPLNAKLGPLAANGGLTLTHLPQSGSLVFDRGSNLAGLAFDQRGVGFARVLQGAADIGAIESVGVAPTAVVTATDVTVAGATSHTVTVTYSDDVGINVSTLGNNDLSIRGPGGEIPVVFTGFTGGGTQVVATYVMVPPGGAWDQFDIGNYAVLIKPGEVSDVDQTPHTVAVSFAGNFRVMIDFDPVVTLTTDEDDLNVGANDISLREAVAIAEFLPGAQAITFDPGAFGTPQTVLLTLGQIAITDSVTITGPAAQLTIDAGGKNRHFEFNGLGQLVAKLANMTLTNGSPSEGDGGSIRIADEFVTFERMAFIGNKATTVNSAGGAIAATLPGSVLTILDSVISNNAATANFGRGGAIKFDRDGTLVLRRSSITGNAAAFNGGGIFMRSDCSLEIEDSTVAGNQANQLTVGKGGGGIYFLGRVGASGFSISNSTISGNSTSKNTGGGIVFVYFEGTALIRNCTVAGNDAATSGGGIARISGLGTLTLHSTIVAGNTVDGAANGKSDLFFDTIAKVGGENNLIGINDSVNNLSLTGAGNLTGTLAAPLNAKLGPLADNGGPTLTHALLAGSPALNNGSNPAGLINDQRGAGFARVVGSAADIGAFESQAAAPPVTITGIQINDGSAQRSRVTSLQVTFNTQVTFAGAVAGAFILSRNGGGAVGGFTATANVVGGVSTVILSAFIGSESQFGSLVDGQYTLSVLASQVLNLDGDGNGTPGDDFVLIGTPANGFFRLFGDGDGDGDVDTTDFGAFRAVFGGTSTMFDFDNDGDVDTSDFGAFRARFGMSV